MVSSSVGACPAPSSPSGITKWEKNSRRRTSSRPGKSSRSFMTERNCCTVTSLVVMQFAKAVTTEIKEALLKPVCRAHRTTCNQGRG